MKPWKSAYRAEVASRDPPATVATVSKPAVAKDPPATKDAVTTAAKDLPAAKDTPVTVDVTKEPAPQQVVQGELPPKCMTPELRTSGLLRR